MFSPSSRRYGMGVPSIIGADELLDADVVDREGDHVGVLRDLLMDLRYGRVAYGLVALCPGPGGSERMIAVPWNAMHVGYGKLKVNAHRDRIEHGPVIPAGAAANPLDHEWAEFIHSYFGTRPYWERSAQHA